MKKIFKIALVYALGALCVFTLAWRANSVDDNNSLVHNYNYGNDLAFNN